MVLSFQLLFLTLLSRLPLNLCPLEYLADADHIQKRDSSAHLCAASEPPRRFEEPSKHTNKCSGYQGELKLKLLSEIE